MELTAEERAIVAGAFLFSGLEDGELRQLLNTAGAQVQAFGKDEVIFSPAHFRNELGIVLRGRVRVTKGEGSLVVSELQSGDLFGAAALFNDEPDYVSTLTARSAVRILFLPQSTVEELMDRSALVRRNYIRYLSGRVRFLSAKIDALVAGTGEKKLAEFLLQNMDGEGRVALPCSMTELAARLHLGRSSLYRELERLEQQGILLREKKALRVLCPGALTEK